MALSVVDLYSKILPKTNCKDCGYQTCIAFAGMVVSEKLPLKNCPHIAPEILESAQEELDEQYKEGKWLKKDMAKEALELAKEKSASMNLEDIALRISGKFEVVDNTPRIVLPYFTGRLLITKEKIINETGEELSRNEETFIHIHMAHGGITKPTGNMKSLKEFPNTVSKIVSMRAHVETPLQNTFASNLKKLANACTNAGGEDVHDKYDAADLAFQFSVFPKIPVVLLFWDQKDDFDAEAKLLFDETIIEHLDIESIMFLSEHLCNKLTKGDL